MNFVVHVFGHLIMVLVIWKLACFVYLSPENYRLLFAENTAELKYFRTTKHQLHSPPLTAKQQFAYKQNLKHINKLIKYNQNI